MLKVKQFVFNPFEENTYLIIDVATGDCAIVDPGMASADDMRQVEDYLRNNHLHLTQIINTHMHLDHIFGAGMVRDRFGVQLKAHRDDEFLGNDFVNQCRRFGIIGRGAVTMDCYLSDGDSVDVGESKLTVLHVPGHSPGGIALYSADNRFVITGDTLFRGSVGRTDLPGGDMLQLINSVKTKLMKLPVDTTVYPGHGPLTTIGHERNTNIYLN